MNEEYLIPPATNKTPADRPKELDAADAKDYEAYDAPHKTDPFKKVHWGTVLGWRRDGYEMKHVRGPDGKFRWGCVLKRATRDRFLIDFAGRDAGVLTCGEWECVAFAHGGGDGEAGLIEHLRHKVLGGGVWFTRVNQENDKNKGVLADLDAVFASARISGVGGGDLYGLWYAGRRWAGVPKLPDEERCCFGRLGTFDAEPIARALLDADLDFEVTDRGKRYGGSKKTWTRVNVRRAGAPKRFVKDELREHPVFRAAPSLLGVMETVAPLDHVDYTMLTKVSPVEGLIARHSDIALDAKAVKLGTAPGRVMRFHFVLQSNPDCTFHVWDLNGVKHSLVMKAGEIWYVDVRKPHAVDNAGGCVRLHLMSDFLADTQPWRRFTEVIG